MRLIDADALETHEIYEGEWVRVVYADDIDNAPTVNAKPLRYGHWIWNNDGMDWGIGAWCCSECGSKAETWWATKAVFIPLRCSGGKFCGNCGAKMEAERGTNETD